MMKPAHILPVTGIVLAALAGCGAHRSGQQLSKPLTEFRGVRIGEVTGPSAGPLRSALEQQLGLAGYLAPDDGQLLIRVQGQKPTMELRQTGSNLQRPGRNDPVRTYATFFEKRETERIFLFQTATVTLHDAHSGEQIGRMELSGSEQDALVHPQRWAALLPAQRAEIRSKLIGWCAESIGDDVVDLLKRERAVAVAQ